MMNSNNSDNTSTWDCFQEPMVIADDDEEDIVDKLFPSKYTS